MKNQHSTSLLRTLFFVLRRLDGAINQLESKHPSVALNDLRHARAVVLSTLEKHKKEKRLKKTFPQQKPQKFA
jgi:hypothetical protein